MAVTQYSRTVTPHQRLINFPIAAAAKLLYPHGMADLDKTEVVVISMTSDCPEIMLVRTRVGE